MAEVEKSKAFLRIQENFLKVRDSYRKSASAYRSILVMGDYGTGKTSLLATCPRPVLVDSFDPGGTNTAVLQPLIKSGDIIVDRSYEEDNWASPTAHGQWLNNMRQRRSDGAFDYIGTYCIDSYTNWAMSLMYDLIAKGSATTKARPGQIPQLADYLLQQMNSASLLSAVLNLPCHILITGHVHRIKNELTGGFESGLLVWGKLADQTPLAFDEKYITWAKREGSEVSHVLQVKNDGYYKAETRMGGAVFSMYEKPNIQELLKKACGNAKGGEPGYIAWQDKERLFDDEKGV